MNVLGVGPLELALVVIIAVVVLGPERFPAAAVHVARAVKFLRGYANTATSELRAEFEELTREYEDLRRELRDVKLTVDKDVGSVTRDVNTAVAEATPKLKLPSPAQLLDPAQPIVEPGGDLPPDRNGASSE